MKMSRFFSMLFVVLISCALFLGMGLSVSAAEEETSEEVTEETEEETAEEPNTVGHKAIAAAVCVGIVAAAGAVSMAFAVGKSTESMARQPEAADRINSSMMLGLVFIETAIIYALFVAILVIFVL